MTDTGSSFWTTFMPHGHYYLWRPDILWLNVVSDALIALVFCSISLGLFMVIRKRPDTPYRGLLLMFSLFIFSFGVTHIVSIWTVWNGDYGLHGLSKGFTVVALVATAILLILKLPRLISLKTLDELRKLNCELKSEVSSQETFSQELRLTESKLKTLLKQTPDGMIIVQASGLIEYSNDMINQMFGYPAGSLTGQHVNKLLSEGSHNKLGPEHNRLFKTDSSLWHTPRAEIKCTHKDGTELLVEIRVKPIKWTETGEVILATLRDISARKAREENERKELLEVAHVSRLTTVDQMAAGIAHELNQPLTAISNNLHTAISIQREKEKPDTELLKLMQENYGSVQRAGQIIRSLRQLVRIKRNVRKKISVNDLVQSTAKLIQPEARAADVSIELDLDHGVPVTQLDIIHTQQVIVNLGRNAIEALEQTGSEERILKIQSRTEENNQLWVRVSDNGPGISDQIKGELFQPYVTDKEDGMGLGLSICKTIIETQGGELWHDDTFAGGAAFCFTLPIEEVN